jgi:hypothetical protein
MTDESRDPKLSQRYRELGADEPPQALDAAILAASRRASKVHAAPLVPPTGRRRWYFPVAAAAIIALAVAMTLQIERQQPDPEAAVEPATPSARKIEPEKKDVQKQEAKPARNAGPAFTPEPPPRTAEEAARDQAAVEQARAQNEQAAREQVLAERYAERERAAASGVLREERPAPSPAPASKPAPSVATAPSAAPRPEARADRRALASVESPERQLERIAELRKQGRDDEADKLLAEFRKRYPGYRISDEVLKRVERK